MKDLLFTTPQQIIDYIPKCIICQKDMLLLFSLYYSERFNLKLKNELLVNTPGKLFKHQIIIDSISGKILEGDDILGRLFTIQKYCKTCYFKINFYFIDKSKNYFPILGRLSEVLLFTKRLYADGNNKILT